MSPDNRVVGYKGVAHDSRTEPIRLLSNEVAGASVASTDSVCVSLALPANK